MATGTQISVEEYLKTVYRPDCDYTDGLVQERNLGERDHSWIQRNLIMLFGKLYQATNIVAMPEWRFQIKPTRFRIPDLVVTLGKPEEQILTKPPLACIEILSPEDTLKRVSERVLEYLEFGVPAVWVIDPAAKSVQIYRQNGMEEITSGSVKVDGTQIEVPFSEIFE